MKIICAGFWKTGTKSLAEALRTLGYKVYDYEEQYIFFADLWAAFREGTVTDDMIRDTLKDVDAIIDGPAIPFWEEIHRAIPDTKVILTTRDEDGWFESYQRLCREFPWWISYPTLFMLLTPSGNKIIRNSICVLRICFGIDGFLRIPFLTITPTNARLYTMQFRKHNCHVIQSVEPDKLHVQKLGDGWGKLCQFLDKDVPDIPYPHLNKLAAHFSSEGGGQHPEYVRLRRQSMALVSVLVALLAYAVYRIVAMFV